MLLCHGEVVPRLPATLADQKDSVSWALITRTLAPCHTEMSSVSRLLACTCPPRTGRRPGRSPARLRCFLLGESAQAAVQYQSSSFRCPESNRYALRCRLETAVNLCAPTTSRFLIVSREIRHSLPRKGAVPFASRGALRDDRALQPPEMT